jgi:hypothetical protein
MGLFGQKLNLSEIRLLVLKVKRANGEILERSLERNAFILFVLCKEHVGIVRSYDTSSQRQGKFCL